MKVLNEIDKKNKTKGEIAKEFGVAASTLSTFIKDRTKIESAVEESTFQPARKRMRMCIDSHQQIEAALVKWFSQARATNLPVSGLILCEKAVSIAQELGVDFDPNPGWLTRLSVCFYVFRIPRNSDNLK